MREVSRDEFFRAVGPQDVHPQSGPDEIIWERRPGRIVVGRSTPGYLCRGPKAYFLQDAALTDRP